MSSISTITIRPLPFCLRCSVNAHVPRRVPQYCLLGAIAVARHWHDHSSRAFLNLSLAHTHVVMPFIHCNRLESRTLDTFANIEVVGGFVR